MHACVMETNKLTNLVVISDFHYTAHLQSCGAVYCNRPVCVFVFCLFVCGSVLLQPACSVCVASERFFILFEMILKCFAMFWS